jgi:hypothetical protein
MAFPGELTQWLPGEAAEDGVWAMKSVHRTSWTEWGPCVCAVCVYVCATGCRGRERYTRRLSVRCSFVIM